MRRMTLLIVVIALPLFAAERWYESYLKGVNAVNAKQWNVAEDALRKAIGDRPIEGMIASRGQNVPYLPHFWLGIAKFHLGDLDAALREWRISEEQGTIPKTDHYATLKSWVAEAQTLKQRAAVQAAAEPKKNANAAMSRALAGQMEALAAGADRSETYRNAQRKLQEALGTFNKAGTDVRAYQRASELASQASGLFDEAGAEAKKQKAIAAAKPKPTPTPQPPAPVPQPVPQPVVVPVPQPPVVVQQQPAPTKIQPAPVQPPAVPVESETLVATRVALQQYRRHLVDAKSRDKQLASFVGSALKTTETWRTAIEQKLDDASLRRIAQEIERSEATLAARMIPPKKTNDPSAQLTTAYRAYASGDVAHAERLLTAALSQQASAEALLLRGAARYTKAMLSRDANAQLDAAKSDFRAALKLNRDVRLDERAFSPKLIAFFEDVRRQ